MSVNMTFFISLNLSLQTLGIREGFVMVPFKFEVPP
jgi:hypothetical protein